MQTSSGVLHNSSIYNTGKLERAYMYKNIEMLYMYDICTCYIFHKMKYYIKIFHLYWVFLYWISSLKTMFQAFSCHLQSLKP